MTVNACARADHFSGCAASHRSRLCLWNFSASVRKFFFSIPPCKNHANAGKPVRHPWHGLCKGTDYSVIPVNGSQVAGIVKGQSELIGAERHFPIVIVVQCLDLVVDLRFLGTADRLVPFTLGKGAAVLTVTSRTHTRRGAPARVFVRCESASGVHGLILSRLIGSCQSEISGLVAGPDQVRQRAIVFVVFLIVPDLESVGVKVGIVIRSTVIIGEPRHAVIGTEKREVDRVVHEMICSRLISHCQPLHCDHCELYHRSKIHANGRKPVRAGWHGFCTVPANRGRMIAK